MPRYKSKMKLHIGETGDVLTPGEIVDFDGGAVLIREGGKEVHLQYPDAFQGAIRCGWLVPEAEEAGEYAPQPAGVEVRSATSTGENRPKLNVVTVQDEERGLGHIGDVRAAANNGRGDVPEVHQASDAAKTRTEAKTGGDDGVVVGRFKSSAKAAPVEIGKNDRQVKQSLDNKSSIELEKVAVATGDVEEARSGETLEDLLPDAATSGTPAKQPEPADLMDALRQALADGTLDPEALAALTQKAPVEQEPAPATQKVDWDLSLHWKTREKKALDQYGDDAAALRHILAMENSVGVKKAIEERLSGLEA